MDIFEYMTKGVTGHRSKKGALFEVGGSSFIVSGVKNICIDKMDEMGQMDSLKLVNF